MAYFARTNGDVQPVFALDTANGAIPPTTSTAASPVQPQGPKLEFFTITLANVAANTTIANQTIQAVQQNATIAIYEFTDTGTDTLAVALYPVGAYDTTSLAAVVDAATGGSSTVYYANFRGDNFVYDC